MEETILKNMEKLKNYRIIDTAFSSTAALMRDIFGENYDKWGDETAKEIYVSSLNILEKIWGKERKLREGE